MSLFFTYRITALRFKFHKQAAPIISLRALRLRRESRARAVAFYSLWKATWSAARDAMWRESSLWRPAPPIAFARHGASTSSLGASVLSSRGAHCGAQRERSGDASHDSDVPLRPLPTWRTYTPLWGQYSLRWLYTAYWGIAFHMTVVVMFAQADLCLPAPTKPFYVISFDSYVGSLHMWPTRFYPIGQHERLMPHMIHHMIIRDTYY